MARELKQSGRQIAERQQALRKTNVYLENLLSSLTTGVLTFASDGRLSGYNAAAERFCQLPLRPLLGKMQLPPSPLTAVLEETVAALQQSGEDSMEKR